MDSSDGGGGKKNMTFTYMMMIGMLIFGSANTLVQDY